ncbi:dihydrolipoamide acetyltransferase family protein [Fictibacillus sp. Mic-4]|uniref:dihydrolipoamide acetyltransferase family protein n=1 Tax=Fictibacillus sp. Mic-4 TaxID=3132826 RepID=UPI003CEF2C46
MPTEIIMPKLGMSMEEGTIVEWVKKKGESVTKGETVVVISSEKIEKDIEAPDDGILLEISAEQDETVEVGKAIGFIGQIGETIDTGETSPGAQETASAVESIPKIERKLPDLHVKPRISPAARKLARASGIDVKDITGTGPQGRVTRSDIERAIKIRDSKERNKEEDNQTIKNIDQERQETWKNGVTIHPVAGMRKVIAKRMFDSLKESAQLTIQMRADVTELLDLQKKMRASMQEAGERVKLTVTDFVARAAILALQKHERMNSLYKDNRIYTYEGVHLGIAVAIDGGLVVPVVMNAEELPIGRLSEKIRQLSEKARSQTLSRDEMEGSTFTITTLGAYGVEFFTPVLNPPEVGILGVGTITTAPAYVGQELKPCHSLPLSLTFDHRAIDGAPASEFLSTIKMYLENPYRMVVY